MMIATNPKYNHDGTVDVTYNHPVLGFVPYTASPNDPEPLGRDLYARAIAGEFGLIAAYIPPPPQPSPVPVEVSVFQGCAMLQQAGILDEVEAYFAALPEDDIRKLAWKKMTVFRRDSTLMTSVGALFGLTSEQIDDLFRFAATIYT